MPRLTIDATGLLPERLELSPARARLFATALVLFGECGSHGVSVCDITDALGQRSGAISAHVQSKRDLPSGRSAARSPRARSATTWSAIPPPERW